MSAAAWYIPSHLRREKSTENRIRHARYRRKLARRNLGYSGPFPLDAEGVAAIAQLVEHRPSKSDEAWGEDRPCVRAARAAIAKATGEGQ